jgi:two-component system nitrate/nitrite response regulator NarL
VRSIVLATEIETRDAHQALKLGAHGVMRKDSSAELLLKGVRSVMAGECWMARENMANFLTWLGNGTSPSADVPTGNHLHLTSRELHIVSAIIEGETNKGIAVRLGLSENTVKHHLTHVFDKLGVSSRLELGVFAQRVLPSQ